MRIQEIESEVFKNGAMKKYSGNIMNTDKTEGTRDDEEV